MQDNGSLVIPTRVQIQILPLFKGKLENCLGNMREKS